MVRTWVLKWIDPSLTGAPAAPQSPRDREKRLDQAFLALCYSTRTVIVHAAWFYVKLHFRPAHQSVDTSRRRVCCEMIEDPLGTRTRSPKPGQ